MEKGTGGGGASGARSTLAFSDGQAAGAVKSALIYKMPRCAQMPSLGGTHITGLDSPLGPLHHDSVTATKSLDLATTEVNRGDKASSGADQRNERNRSTSPPLPLVTHLLDIELLHRLRRAVDGVLLPAGARSGAEGSGGRRLRLGEWARPRRTGTRSVSPRPSAGLAGRGAAPATHMSSDMSALLMTALRSIPVPARRTGRGEDRDGE